jgi:hypothetical protein
VEDAAQATGPDSGIPIDEPPGSPFDLGHTAAHPGPYRRIWGGAPVFYLTALPIGLARSITTC